MQSSKMIWRIRMKGDALLVECCKLSEEVFSLHSFVKTMNEGCAILKNAGCKLDDGEEFYHLNGEYLGKFPS